MERVPHSPDLSHEEWPYQVSLHLPGQMCRVERFKVMKTAAGWLAVELASCTAKRRNASGHITDLRDHAARRVFMQSK